MAKRPPPGPDERRLISRSLQLAAAIIVLDQATKVTAAIWLAGHSPVTVIPGLFDLVYRTNPGAAWGMFSQLAWSRWLLLAISAGVLAIILWQYRDLTENHPLRCYALGMVIGGVVGNGLDRAWRGEVVDFLDFYWKTWHWPAFNVADSAICVGVICYLFVSCFMTKTEPPPEPPPTS